MPNAFATISFTESVKAAQTRYGSRESNLAFEQSDDPRNVLGEFEMAFIERRDSFYQATISENGWPYVQHRGGPRGFLKVLDARTIGFADLKGNRQYISVGNLNANARISLILMDYPNRRRLKIWGTTRIVHEDDEPELVARLEVSSYRARVERGIVIQVEAIEWNCPQHITPRFTQGEVDGMLQVLVEENQRLKTQLSQSAAAQSMAVKPINLGNGELELLITGVRQLTPKIRAYELQHPECKALPAVSAGSHIKVPVLLADGSASSRHYSINSNPEQRNHYEIAVLLDEQGSGGSRFVHENYQVGMRIHCALPRNDFALPTDDSPIVLIAGGIGITPILAMATTLKHQGKVFQFHYVGRRLEEMAYVENLQSEFGEQLNLYTSQQQSLDLVKTMSNVSDASQFYVCGPERLIDGVMQTAKKLAVAESRIHFERFSSASSKHQQAIVIELRQSNKTLVVGATESILETLENTGIKTLSDCKVGNCGVCAVKVLEGRPQHYDNVLTERERAQGMMCICVSRAMSAKLVLDL
jgi:ferredoxin-NADP reductase/predicted pyridoxine 5'-phosphate oxidase superfamily flavin-nucleotide-binding protein